MPSLLMSSLECTKRLNLVNATNQPIKPIINSLKRNYWPDAWHILQEASWKHSKRGARGEQLTLKQDNEPSLTTSLSKSTGTRGGGGGGVGTNKAKYGAVNDPTEGDDILGNSTNTSNTNSRNNSRSGSNSAIGDIEKVWDGGMLGDDGEDRGDEDEEVYDDDDDDEMEDGRKKKKNKKNRRSYLTRSSNKGTKGKEKLHGTDDRRGENSFIMQG